MSSCLNTGGGRPYGFSLDIIKSPSPLTACSSHSSSPSSTLSDSSNSPLTISTRKPRSPRKRPNQTYMEAAALLSKIYPNIFSTKNLRKPCKHARSYDSFPDSSELLPRFPSFDNAAFLLSRPFPEEPTSLIEPKPVNSREMPQRSLTDTDFQPSSPNEPHDSRDEDFDAESILDEEIEEGIDSIMGNLSVNNDSQYNSYDFRGKFEFGFGFGFGFGQNVKALKQVEDGDWWRNPTIDVSDISPKFKVADKKKKKTKNATTTTTKKKMKKVEEDELQGIHISEENLRPGLGLKLNYEEVLNAWSGHGSPFSDKMPKARSRKSSADTTIARLKDFELCLGMESCWEDGEENGGVREASVLRYKEKKRNRLFGKKIRYQVRKANADRRPRMKASKIHVGNVGHEMHKGQFLRRLPLIQMSGEG